MFHVLQVTSNQPKPPSFAANTAICLGIPNKVLYGRGIVVRAGAKLAAKYDGRFAKKLADFVEVANLTVVADQGTVLLQTIATTN